ncbi:hypothetical protein J6590_040359 [Homalodisca vitripennis]|nr:hypothetical protein J6590_040359 [Homalodisca vitripennis]
MEFAFHAFRGIHALDTLLKGLEIFEGQTLKLSLPTPQTPYCKGISVKGSLTTNVAQFRQYFSSGLNIGLYPADLCSLSLLQLAVARTGQPRTKVAADSPSPVLIAPGVIQIGSDLYWREGATRLRHDLYSLLLYWVLEWSPFVAVWEVMPV